MKTFAPFAIIYPPFPVSLRSRFIGRSNQEGAEGWGNSLGYLCLIPICAFLNSRGGQLIIGVNDDKSVGGLTLDLALMKEKSDPRDEFQLRLRGLMERYMPPYVFSCLDGSFHSIQNNSIFLRPSSFVLRLSSYVLRPT